MIHSIFEICVRILYVAGQWLGIGYEAINVWVFVIIWPIVTVVLAVVIAAQAAELRHLRRPAAAPTPEVKP